MSRYPRILPAGEAAFTVELGDEVSEALNRRVHALDAALRAQPFAGLQETVPSYRSLLVFYDPLQAGPAEVQAALAQALRRTGDATAPVGRLVEIPVRYGGEWGRDLGDVAAHAGLSAAEVVRLHAGADYTVAMQGFAPGFAYLLGLPPQLATPRLATPRLRVEPGSVGIAGAQAGIYALATPGGWRIIGRTPLPLFAPGQGDPFTLHAGDRVCFAVEGLDA